MWDSGRGVSGVGVSVGGMPRVLVLSAQKGE